MATKCVVFKRSAKKGGRRISPKRVCFKRKEATPAEKRAKGARGRRILKSYACKARGLTPALKKACRKLGA